MKIQSKRKQTYVPCEVNIVEFDVERGFAQASSAVGVFTNVYNQNSCTWEMDADGNGEYKSDGYAWDGVAEWEDAQRSRMGI